MSQRRSNLLQTYCCRRLSAMNLSNAEVNGMQSTKNKSITSVARFEQKHSTRPTTNWSDHKKRFNEVNWNAIHEFEQILGKAEAFEDRGAYGKAESLYNQLIHFCKRRFSAKRYETAIPYNHLALLQFRRGRLELAKNLFERSLEILIRTMGANHRHARTVRANLDDLLRAMPRGPLSSE
jgi:tetratricopeptide (TPR) repeat protein